MSFHPTPTNVLAAAVICLLMPAQGATSRIEWPTQAKSLATNSLPIVVAGVPHGFLGATFQMEQFDPETTVLQGTIVLTNRTEMTNSITMCLLANTISYHIEMLDMQGNVLMDPNGAKYNWDAQVFNFTPHESKRYPIKVRLRDYFDIKSGLCQLLFIFDERMIRDVGHDGYAMKAWACERIILRCDKVGEETNLKTNKVNSTRQPIR